MKLAQDDLFKIELNCNYKPDVANGFLMYKPTGECLGGFQLLHNNDKWMTDISCRYDEETESDIIVIGEFDTQKEAADALWKNRHIAEALK